MLKIALCDDDAVFLKELTGKIQELLRFEEKNAAIASFVNPTALTASVASGDRFDIFILDVEMPQIDGFKVAADLRKYQPNVALIFLTSHLQYAPEGYKVDALRFISKLNVDETLPEALQKALHTLEQQDQHSLLVQHYKNFSRVLYQNIIYVRKTARSVQIITSNQGVIKDNRGIKELFGILNDPRFIFVDRSYFVNLDYAKELCGDSIIMLSVLCSFFPITSATRTAPPSSRRRLQAEDIKRRDFLHMHKFPCSAISPQIPSFCLSKYVFWISSVCKPV